MPVCPTNSADHHYISSINTEANGTAQRYSEFEQSFSHTSICLHILPATFLCSLTMSTCGNCDCADKTNCPKKGNSLDIGLIETRKRYYADAVEAAPAAEHDGKCKCGTSCTGVDCTCGN
ncbi:hypothetical protein HHK36_005339 [Tetracentron sinense]|uniref:Metallothionein n=1 Tax=Tetracentron sinense TaxID=13715 RepID=A0A834ZKU1_TETSI|nr:hypothetical protein HHK36_005339 [Tetracentron sinense]